MFVASCKPVGVISINPNLLTCFLVRTARNEGCVCSELIFAGTNMKIYKHPVSLLTWSWHTSFCHKSALFGYDTLRCENGRATKSGGSCSGIALKMTSRLNDLQILKLHKRLVCLSKADGSDHLSPWFRPITTRFRLALLGPQVLDHAMALSEWSGHFVTWASEG